MIIDKEKSVCVLNIRYPVTYDYKEIVEKIEKVCGRYDLRAVYTDNNPPLYADKTRYWYQHCFRYTGNDK